MAVGENSISIAKIRLNEKLIRIIFELGLGEMPSANAFVEYIAEKYALPKSSVWYSLKRLKELGILLMGDKNNKSSLALTEKGSNSLFSFSLFTSIAKLAKVIKKRPLAIGSPFTISAAQFK